ncbi:MaoC family dehydratase N-terminal domain-containing protein [Acidiferrimicrobium sp. IK]|uniref:MaoC family dehydratase N-terminal domain-containing protein n=1 Tax=Acidiferrimicrobium sp. IK TaxID=2871700 RepID=UPI0021CB0A79|nr:MaoC family dehydratase N-terminal domain-containing protein [Acidiferrimicrobium sp. IK]MCU4186352.1 MaoC family dehydratase N-terminal domain-containing protein [Acidiferrimicrobium sp. IK]
MTIERFPVEATHTMMFARAIGDPNPAFADPESPEAAAVGGVVAPPTFAMAGFQFDPDNPLRPKPGQPWFGSGREPSGEQREGGGVLHAEQVFEYHQPLRVGMVLTTTERAGRTWDKQSRSGATLHFSETITEFRDAGSDELVVTATMVGVKTEPAAESKD